MDRGEICQGNDIGIASFFTPGWTPGCTMSQILTMLIENLEDPEWSGLSSGDWLGARDGDGRIDKIAYGKAASG